MVNYSQKNWRSRHATWASWALMACMAGAVGCGEMDEMDDSDALVETQQQAMEAERGAAEPAATKPLPDDPDDGSDPKADFGLHAHSPYGGDWMNISWTAHPGMEFKVCWKKVSDSGTVCYNNSFDITAGGSNYFSGTQYAGFPTECGGVDYKIRVKRNAFSYQTITKKTSACDPADMCPYGGWYDGANCQIGQAPAGTTAFTYNGAYYYTYASGAEKCPYPGSFDDSANCFVQWIPSGADAFIYQNHWYYQAVN